MNKPPYEILEHPADIGLRVYGRTLAELFAHSGHGLAAIALDSEDSGSAERVLLSAQGTDREDLLVNWLSEILYYMDAEGWIFRDFRIQKISDKVIEGEGLGERRDPARSQHSVAVKAVTYHQLSVRKTEEGWEAVVYLDI
ncbi:MAG: archease [Acidobacteriota bacterium]